MKILITSGGTREKIDPVRYIGNYSSGKMGAALADAFATYGEVKVISGPAEVHYKVPMQRIESAREMLESVQAELPIDIFVAAAAVADKRPKNYSDGKMKKESFDSLELADNPDILAFVGNLPPSNSLPTGGRAPESPLPSGGAGGEGTSKISNRLCCRERKPSRECAREINEKKL